MPPKGFKLSSYWDPEKRMMSLDYVPDLDQIFSLEETVPTQPIVFSHHGPESVTVVLRIDTINPVHARVSLFSSSRRHGVDSVGVGHSGQLTIDAELLPDFINKIDPDRVTWVAGEEVPQWLKTDKRFDNEPT